ncbi:MAG: hypothetical protein P1V51_03575 [Deltaproteobacteria bacterium]|nr:hypothetical protein [Deltaproteobacteria bacterium]
MSPRFLARLALPLLAVAAMACGPGPEQACDADDQCSADEVCEAGRCMLPGDPDGGASDASTDAGLDGGGDGGLEDGGTDGGSDGGSDGGTDGGTDGGGSCTIVADGRISAEEAPVVLDLPVKYLEADPADPFPVDLVGADEAGTTVWDLSGAYPGDHAVTIGASALAGHWFEHDFPGPFTGTVLVLPLEGDAGNYGVYERTGDALRLHGVASALPDETSIQYEPPIDVIRYPLELGASWSQTTSTLGTFEGLYFQSTDTWALEVEAAGVVDTPAGRFEALRLRTVLEVELPILVWPFSLTYRYVRYTFVTPCLGVAAQVASVEDETELLFTQAAELRRFSL